MNYRIVLAFALLLILTPQPVVAREIPVELRLEKPRLQSAPKPMPSPTPQPTLTPMPTVTPTATPTPSPTPVCTAVTGRASQYASGVMHRVTEYRQRHGQIAQDVSAYDGFIAVLECDDIGKEYWLRPAGSEAWDFVLAVDCASPYDQQSETDLRSGRAWMISENVCAEVDYETAVRWDTVGRMIEVEMKHCEGGKP